MKKKKKEKKEEDGIQEMILLRFELFLKSHSNPI